MTSQAPPDGNGNLVDKADLYYTNEDVALLHEIVAHAEQLLPSLPPRERVPTNALFNAYYSILPSMGIDVDHDSRYARVLFKIGGMQGNGNLYEKFEAVLSRMGIEIQFDGESEQHEQSQIQESHEPTYSNILHASQPATGTRQSSRPRRNSESTLWDFIPEPDRRARRPRSQSSISRPDAELLDRPFLRERQRQTDNVSVSHAQALPPITTEGRDIGTWLSTTVEPSIPLQSQDSEDGRLHGRKLRMVHRHRLKDYSTEASTYDDDRSDSAIGEIVAQDFNIPAAISAATAQSNLPASDTILDIKASLIRDHHLRNHVRQTFEIWRYRTVQMQIHDNHLIQLAIQHDRRILLCQAIETWKTQLHDRRQLAETERFFAHLEERAMRARDLFLLTKAFTHWAQTTSDEIHRTSLARRHILRTRFFKAWREITAVNELKVRRHALKKFFGQWQKRCQIVREDVTKAIASYDDNLVRGTYWAWFWKFCERRAPAWHDARIKRRAVLSWAATSQRNLETVAQAATHNNFMIKAKPFWKWKQKAQNHTNLMLTASQHNARALLLHSLVKWHSESTLLPCRFQVQNKVAARLKRDCFRLWKMRASQEHAASASDRRKVLREAFTTWNDKLRSKILLSRMNQRILSQSLYQWVVAERYALIRCISDQKSQRLTLALLLHRAHVSRIGNSEAERQAREFSEWNAKSGAIRLLRMALQHQRELENQAVLVNAPRLKADTVRTWSKCLRHTREMDGWAQDGEFYFLTTKTLKRWRIATELSKREKRREAYTQLRRQNKIRLAGRILSLWRQKTEQVVAFNSQADAFQFQKIIRVGVEAFDRWKATSREIAALEAMHRVTVLRKHLQKWKSHFVHDQALEANAVAFCEDRIASHAVKKWRRDVLQLKGREYVAGEKRDESRKRVLRRMLLYWRSKTPYSKHSTDDGSATLNAQSRMGETTRAQAWSEMGDEVEADEWNLRYDAPAMATPLPGYLSTPSKRVQRVRAVAHQSTTTPIAPLSSPFEKMLRAQYSGGSLTSFRRTHGRFPPGEKGGGFADIGR